MSTGTILDHPERWREIDVADAGLLIRDLPEQLLAGASRGAAAAAAAAASPGHIAFLGMGGSGIVGRILAAYLGPRAKIPAAVIRDFALPAWLGKDTLVAAISYSGNTRETLAAAAAAARRRASLVAVTSGGKLAAFARENGYPIIEIPPGQPPRCSLGLMAGGLMSYFTAAGLVAFPPAEAIAGHLRRGWRRWGFDVPTAKNDAKKLALAIHNAGAAAAYGAGPLAAVAAERYRAQLAENAKFYAAFHRFPELCHNELVAFERPNDIVRHLHLVVFRPAHEEAAAAAQVDAALALVADAVAGVFQLRARAEEDLAALLEMIYFGDLASYYLALQRGVDPTPVANIDRLKARIARA